MSLPALPSTSHLLVIRDTDLPAQPNTGHLFTDPPALPNTGHLLATRDTDLPALPNTGTADNGCAKPVAGTYSDFAPMFSPTKAFNA